MQRSSDASYQVVAGEAIVIHLKTGVYYSLNEVGTAFWDLMDGTLSIADCAQRISDMLVDDRPHSPSSRPTSRKSGRSW